MENAGRVISKAEVTETLVRNILSDQEEFRNARSILRHGQKDRLMEAMAAYPLLDETFDSSLDADGVENLIKILGTLESDTNVFIISHKHDALDGKFKAKLEFYKEKNFSYCR